MRNLEDRIGYQFHNRDFLLTALTHSSYANERRKEHCQSYERLEFLGDSILGQVTAEFLYRHEPPLPEGQMTRLRAELVCEASLHKVALELGIRSYMRLGKGEEASGGRDRTSILADMVEAIIAAMYLDSGIEEPRRFIYERILQNAQISVDHQGEDYKTMLQELVQQKSDQHIFYEMIGESGPDHNKRFQFRVCINGVSAGEGIGRTKKEAEQMAAREALKNLQQ